MYSNYTHMYTLILHTHMHTHSYITHTPHTHTHTRTQPGLPHLPGFDPSMFRAAAPHLNPAFLHEGGNMVRGCHGDHSNY